MKEAIASVLSHSKYKSGIEMLLRWRPFMFSFLKFNFSSVNDQKTDQTSRVPKLVSMNLCFHVETMMYPMILKLVIEKKNLSESEILALNCDPPLFTLRA